MRFNIYQSFDFNFCCSCISSGFDSTHIFVTLNLYFHSMVFRIIIVNNEFSITPTVSPETGRIHTDDENTACLRMRSIRCNIHTIYIINCQAAALHVNTGRRYSRIFTIYFECHFMVIHVNTTYRITCPLYSTKLIFMP